MNMGYLDSQPYSKAFRRKYPKVNGLFWGYHWLQGTMYDTLYGRTLEEQRNAYAEVRQALPRDGVVSHRSPVYANVR
jgi:virulence-associated protein VapD